MKRPLHAVRAETARHREQRPRKDVKREDECTTHHGGGGIHMKSTAAGSAARWQWRQVEARHRRWWEAATAVMVSAVVTGVGLAVALRRRAGGSGGQQRGRRQLGRHGAGPVGRPCVRRRCNGSGLPLIGAIASSICSGVSTFLIFSAIAMGRNRHGAPPHGDCR